MGQRTRTAVVGTTTACLGVVLNACGSEPTATPIKAPPSTSSAASAAPTSAPTPTVASASDPESAYRAWLAALEALEAQAVCARNAPSFTIALRQDAILEKRARLGDPCVNFVALLWEDADREYDPISIEATQVTDERAILAVDFPVTDQTVTMTVPRGVGQSWYVAQTVDRTAGAEDDTARWVEAWCVLDSSMSTDEIVDLMGPPSGEYTVSNGGEPQLYWARREYDFRVYFDIKGSVLDLVGDYDALSVADRGQLECPELR